jgi:hypothetical protein
MEKHRISNDFYTLGGLTKKTAAQAPQKSKSILSPTSRPDASKKPLFTSSAYLHFVLELTGTSEYGVIE